MGPIPASNLSLAKGLAAERARQILEDPNGPYYLGNICDCAHQMAVDRETPVFEMPSDLLNDETEVGFAALARLVAGEVKGETTAESDADPQEEEEELSLPSTGRNANGVINNSDYVEGEVFTMPEF